MQIFLFQLVCLCDWLLCTLVNRYGHPIGGDGDQIYDIVETLIPTLEGFSFYLGLGTLYLTTHIN